MASEKQPVRVIGGRYRLVEQLGSGGFGRVWKARDEALHDDVAVKEVRLPDSASDVEREKMLAYAKREAINAAQLRNHPNIVTIYNIIIENGIPWIVMQLVDGCSLAEQLDAHGPLSVEETAKVATCVLRALGAAHAAGIVHRDIKPRQCHDQQRQSGAGVRLRHLGP